MKKEQLTYLLARLPIGMAFFGHGLIRLTKLCIFSNWMVGQFSKSFMPAGVVVAFSYALPFLEFITGLLLLIGLFTRFSIILGAAVMLALIFGSCMIEQWENVFVQLIYGGYLAVLFYYADYNGFAVDGLISKAKN